MGIESGVQQPWPWPDDLDAMIAAPAFHRQRIQAYGDLMVERADLRRIRNSAGDSQ